jgi:hypothetical protein
LIATTIPRCNKINLAYRPHNPCPNFLPEDIKNSLRVLVLRSPNPQKSLAYFRSKFDNFLSRSVVIDEERHLRREPCVLEAPSPPAPAVTAALCADDKGDPSPAIIRVLPPIPVKALPDGLLRQEGEDLSVTALKTALETEHAINCVPERAADKEKIPRHDNQGNDSTTPSNEGADPGIYGDAKIMVAMPTQLSICPPVSRFYGGSNHRFKAQGDELHPRLGPYEDNELLQLSKTKFSSLVPSLEQFYYLASKQSLELAGSMNVQEATSVLSHMGAPPIQDCLREDGCPRREIGEEEEAQGMASAFLKTNLKVIGKRPGSCETMMLGSSPSHDDRINGGSDKLNQGISKNEEEVVTGGGDDGADKEAASLGAAGQLTGADDRAGQEP